MSLHDRGPERLPDDGATAALVEQGRSKAIDALRTATAVTLAYRNPDGSVAFWTFAPDADGVEFLALALAHFWHGVSTLLGDPGRDRMTEVVHGTLDAYEESVT